MGGSQFAPVTDGQTGSQSAKSILDVDISDAPAPRGRRSFDVERAKRLGLELYLSESD